MSPDGKRLLLVRREQGHIDQLGVVLRLFEGIEAARN